MIPVSLEWVAEQVQGQLQGDNLQIRGVTTDTRQLQQGDLFIALVGPNFNGHDFIAKAEQLGAAALLVSEPVQSNLPQVLVADTRLALGQLGAAVKAEIAPLTIGITGSSGKTTVKEMVAAIMSRRGKVLYTQGNFNNDIGVPLTLLRLEREHDIAVIEMGANHLGEIAYTTALAKPDIACVVNAAEAHLEGFGSLLGVARAKSEIFRGLPEKGTAVLNADSPFFKFWQTKVRPIKTLSFGSENDAQVSAHDIQLNLDGCAEFELHCQQGTAAIRLTIPGEHNVSNALCAASLCLAAGASLEDVQLGLANMHQVQGRLNVRQLTRQVRVLDDSYNANVASAMAAIDLLASFSGRKVLILGDMAELGGKARFYHQVVGEYAEQKGVHELLSLGELSQHASAVFNDRGTHFFEVEELIVYLESLLQYEQRDISILVKGSRSARMERVVAALESSSVGKLQRSRERIAC